MLATQHRINQIFNLHKLRKIVIKDTRVWLYTLVIVAPQFLLNIIWSGVGGLTLTLVTPDLNRPALIYYTCSVDHASSVFAGLSLAYFLLLMLAMCIMAFRIRNVDDQFNDAKTLVMSVYTLVLTWSFVVAIEFQGIGDRVDHYWIRSLVVLLTFLALQGILFVPKVVRIAAGHIPETTTAEKPASNKHTSQETKKGSKASGLESKTSEVLDGWKKNVGSAITRLDSLMLRQERETEILLALENDPEQRKHFVQTIFGVQADLTVIRLQWEQQQQQAPLPASPTKEPMPSPKLDPEPTQV